MPELMVRFTIRWDEFARQISDGMLGLEPCVQIVFDLGAEGQVLCGSIEAAMEEIKRLLRAEKQLRATA